MWRGAKKTVNRVCAIALRGIDKNRCPTLDNLSAILDLGPPHLGNGDSLGIPHRLQTPALHVVTAMASSQLVIRAEMEERSMLCPGERALLLWGGALGRRLP